MGLGDWVSCIASCPIPSHICRFFFGCNLDKSPATFLCLLQDHFRSSNEQPLVARKAQLKWNGKRSQLFGSFRLRQVVWWPDCTWLDWLNPFIRSSLTCSLIHLLIHSTSMFQLSPVCHALWIWPLSSFPFWYLCLSGQVIYHHLGARMVNRRELTESHTGKTLVFREMWVRWVRHLYARTKSCINFNLNLKLRGN